MCGLSGYNFKEDQEIGDEKRMKLVLGLGSGIDSRGGHAAGYVSIGQHSIKYCRKIGKWLKAKDRFIKGASENNLCVMHARFATCGDRDQVNQAHPFNIKRNDKTVLFGCHNGMIGGAFESAKAHGRNISVDSQEVFELIADKDYEGIQKLTGYGVITWIEPDKKDFVNIVKLSNHADICIIKTKEGGIVWGSTWAIVGDALKLAGLTAANGYKDLDIGRVYEIHPGELRSTSVTGIKLGDRYASNNTNSTARAYGYFGWDGDDEEDTDIGKPTTNKSGSAVHGYTKNGKYVPITNGQITRGNGDVEWYKTGELHREDGPAVIKNNGDKEWFFKGKHHREDGPAIERNGGGFSYYINGDFHREDGPAVMYPGSDKVDHKPWTGYYLKNQYFKDIDLWQAAVEKLQEECKQAAAKKEAEEKTTKKDDLAGGAFMREMHQLWNKWDNEDNEDNEDSEKNRFLTKGMM